MRKKQLLPEPLLAPEKSDKEKVQPHVLCNVPSIQDKEVRSPTATGPTMSYQCFRWGDGDIQIHGSKLKSASESPAEFGGKSFPPARLPSGNTCQIQHGRRVTCDSENGSCCRRQA